MKFVYAVVMVKKEEFFIEGIYSSREDAVLVGKIEQCLHPGFEYQITEFILDKPTDVQKMSNFLAMNQLTGKTIHD